MRQTIECIPHHACTGCGACMNKCPKNAIVMEYDENGFIRPRVTEDCVNCGICTSVCPVEHPAQFHETPRSYAVWASNEIRMKSSSGGMFTLLANEILKHKGAVCGAAYAEDYQTVRHIWAETPSALDPLRGSKYVQSDTGTSYQDAKRLLDKGRPVLYTGCPCQIAGLYNYLGKQYDNLYTADIVCHGANSVTAYQSYIREFTEGKEIASISFRDKQVFGWASTATAYLKDGTIKKASHQDSAWYRGFLEGVTTRENCAHCPYARKERIADITLADCWQVKRIDPALDDGKGTSLVLVNSDKGRKLFQATKRSMQMCREVPLDELCKYNGQLNRPTPSHPSRRFFYEHLPKDGFHKSLWYGRGMRFDVGVVGWWFASNYGSCLTYYALGCFLADMGKQILLVKLPTMSGSPWDADTQISIRFLSKYFKVSADRDISRLHEVNRFCDAFMLGSDQMWREDSLRLVGYSFFLDFVDKDKKKIAFSSSFGNEHFTDNKEIQATVSDLLQRFDAISVREKSGIGVCKREFGVEAQQLLDPVFLCKKEAYDRVVENIHEEVPKKYLLCYILDPSPEKEQAAQEIAAHEGLEIITILGMKEYAGAVKRWNTGKVMPKVSPEQFIYYIKNCSYMLTDSHHGTCFAIIFEKQYAALVNKSRGATRFETVAEALDLKDRLFTGAEDIRTSERPYVPIDYAHVADRLKAEIDRASEWLTNALTCPTKQAEETLRTLTVNYNRQITGLTNRLNALEARVNTLTAQNEKNIKELAELKQDVSAFRQSEPPVAPKAAPDSAKVAPDAGNPSLKDKFQNMLKR